MTKSEEDYIKTIYHLGRQHNGFISTSLLSDKMNIKPSSVTDMVQKLSEKSLVNYRKYKGVRLTDSGTLKAVSLVRKHRLWEVFLVNKLNFSWDEVHEIAEQLEHIKSDKLVDRLDELLDYPKFDPHGDPIPSKNGNYTERAKRLLSEAPLKVPSLCLGVKDSSGPFLKFLDKHQIAIGDTITILDKEEFDASLSIQIGERELRISNQIASNVFVKLL